MRIAMLEDESDHADRAAALLRGAGHQVHIFSRGRALLRDLRSETYELIILDWEIPDVLGYDVLRTIRGMMALRTPVLFLTHRDAEDDVVAALEAGADDFLIKPPASASCSPASNRPDVALTTSQRRSAFWNSRPFESTCSDGRSTATA